MLLSVFLWAPHPSQPSLLSSSLYLFIQLFSWSATVLPFLLNAGIFFSVLIFIVCFPLSFASLFFLLTSLHSFAVSLLLCITRLEIVSLASCSDHLQWKSVPWIWQSKIYIGYISRAERIRLQRKKDAVAFSCNRSHWLAEDNYKIHPVTNYTETVSYSVFIGVRVYACFSLSVQLLV